MAVVKGRFIDATTPVRSDNDPVDPKDLARKSYVDQKASAEASAKVDKAGDEMSGNLLVKNDLIATGFTAEIAPGNFIAKKMSEDGEEVLGLSSLDCGSVTIIGPGGLPGVPTEESHATTKKYVDDLLAGKSDVGHTHVAADITDFSSAASAAAPVQSVAGKVGEVSLVKGDVGLSNVDNTADLDKPISTATATALAGKVSKAGDTMTGELILQDGLSTLNPISGFDSGGEHTLTIAPEYAEFILRKENFQTSITPNYALFTEIDTEGSGSWKGITFIEKSSIYLYDENNNPSLPVEPAQVTTKAYVDGLVANKADQSSIASIESNISSLQSVDSGLQSQINTEKGRIDAILSASQADKDSFAEIVQLINSVDTENDSAFASYVLSNNAALAAEQARAEGEEARIEAKVNTEKARASDAEAALQTNITAEETRALAAESLLQSYVSGVESNLANEVLARQSGDQAVQASVDAEALRAQNEEARIEAKIDQEIADRQAADQTLSSGLNALDQGLGGLYNRVDALEAATSISPVQGQKFGVNLSAQDVANGYVDMPFEPMPMTMMVVVSGIVHSEEEDYTLSTSNGVTRISFIGDLAAKLQEGDKLRVQFLKGSNSSSGGGGGGGGLPPPPSINDATAMNNSTIRVDYTNSSGQQVFYRVLRITPQGGPGEEIASGEVFDNPTLINVIRNQFEAGQIEVMVQLFVNSGEYSLYSNEAIVILPSIELPPIP